MSVNRRNFIKKCMLIGLLVEHAREYSNYKPDMEKYIRSYFIGHYNPKGNFFCAGVLKNRLIELLDPKPLPYRL